MSQAYHAGQRALQDQFDTRRLADRLAESTVDTIGRYKAFIERRDMFFLATATADGWPECSYKGGEPGFVRVLDEHTPKVGMLFVDLEGGTRLRLNGAATIDPHDPLIATYPGAQMVVRVRVREVFPNCRRYVHRYQLVRRSPFVPDAEGAAPVPDWKRDPWFKGTLPAGDRALDPGCPSAPSQPEF
jgi:hypothetical protein